MSTFGKKSLIWWDYENRSKENAIRFNHSPMDIQLEILTKWFPVGSRCHLIRPWDSKVKHDYKIIGYTKHTCYYSIEVESIKRDKSTTIAGFISKHKKTINPTNIILSSNDLKRIKRESKLDRLGF